MSGHGCADSGADADHADPDTEGRAGDGTGGTPDGTSRRRRLTAMVDGGDPAPAPCPAATLSPESAIHGAGPGPPRSDGGAAVRRRLARLCRTAVSVTGVDGAGITVMGSLEGGREGSRDQVSATGALTGPLEELQLTVGEGPCLDAYASGAPSLVGDLAAETARWPGFAPEALAAGTGAVFSLPLQVGAVRLGTLDLNRAATGWLYREQLADVLALAELATETLLELAEVDGDDRPDDGHDTRGGSAPLLAAGWLPDVHADVHVASGIVAARAGVAVRSALLRIRGYAYTHGEPIHRVARRIIARDLELDDPSDRPPPDGHGPDSPPAPDSETT